MAGRPKSDGSTSNSTNMTSAEKIAAARARQASMNNDESHDYQEINYERKKEVNLVKHTETIDRLVLQNKQLQKDLSDADNEIDELEKKLDDSSLKISKNLFYIGLGVALYLIYVVNGHLVNVNTKLTETNVILKEYKNEIEKTKLYNDILEKKLGIEKKK